MTKKKYEKPMLNSEIIEIGVFGNYGRTGGGNGHGHTKLKFSPVRILNPLFHYCCG